MVFHKNHIVVFSGIYAKAFLECFHEDILRHLYENPSVQFHRSTPKSTREDFSRSFWRNPLEGLLHKNLWILMKILCLLIVFLSLLGHLVEIPWRCFCENSPSPPCSNIQSIFSNLTHAKSFSEGLKIEVLNVMTASPL